MIMNCFQLDILDRQFEEKSREVGPWTPTTGNDRRRKGVPKDLNAFDKWCYVPVLLAKCFASTGRLRTDLPKQSNGTQIFINRKYHFLMKDIIMFEQMVKHGNLLTKTQPWRKPTCFSRCRGTRVSESKKHDGRDQLSNSLKCSYLSRSLRRLSIAGPAISQIDLLISLGMKKFTCFIC